MTESTEKVSLSAQEHPIKKIFCDDYLFEIPGYQRPYSWTTEQASALVEDLQDCIKQESGNIESLNPYFLGSIVLIKKIHEAKSEVIDGQQRLTTLTILFSVLRYLLKKEDTGNSITKYLFQTENKLEGTKKQFRIFLREKDKEFFQKNIQEDDGIEALISSNEELKDSRLNIKQNAICMHDKLKNEKPADLENLATFIVSCCYLVVVTTPDHDSANRIFSVLNSRGLDLTATDMLKSEIIGVIPDSEQQSYTDKWEDAEESIGRDRFNDLFSHIRMIYRKSKPKGTLIKEFDSHVNPKEDPKQFIDDKLIPYSEAYANIINENFASKEKAESINEMLRWLNCIDNSDWVPSAIYYLSENKDHPDKLLAFFEELERLAACMMISRKTTNYRIKRYSDLLTWIEKEKKDALSPKSPIHLTEDEIGDTLSALNGNVYENIQTRRMILLRLDSLLADCSATYNYKIITVEHVLPQNPKPSSQWVKWIPDEEKRKDLVHKLGNLALLSKSKNSAASNYELNKKKKEYFEAGDGSPFLITNDIRGENTWTEDVIRNRQKKFIKKFVQEWNLKKA